MDEAVTDSGEPAGALPAGTTVLPGGRLRRDHEPCRAATTAALPGPAELAAMRRALGRCRNISIGEVPGCGLGIFAATGFRAGQAIVVDEDGSYFEQAIDEAQVRRLGLNLSTHCFQVGHDRYLLPKGSIDDLINHSCAPNCGIRLGSLGYRLIALHDIAVGEQLTYDYSTHIGNPRERMVCACAARHCRGEIGPFRELPLERRAFYLAHDVVGRFLLEEMQPAAGRSWLPPEAGPAPISGRPAPWATVPVRQPQGSLPGSGGGVAPALKPRRLEPDGPPRSGCGG